MKLGMTFSGSGPDAAYAHELAEELWSRSVRIEMLSATSLASIPALLWARGLGPEETGELMDLFMQAHTPACGLMELERMGVFGPGHPRCGLAISSADISTGVTAIFCDTLRSDAWNLKVYPLSGNERKALSAAICPFGGGDPLSWDGMQLCDFAARYGCPFFPLRMAGMERVISACFPGGDTPAQIAAGSLSTLTAKNADLCYTAEGGREALRRTIRDNISELHEKLLS